MGLRFLICVVAIVGRPGESSREEPVNARLTGPRCRAGLALQGWPSSGPIPPSLDAAQHPQEMLAICKSSKIEF